MRGISLHLGLNRVDFGKHGWTGKVPSCENDARAMYDIAIKQGFEAEIALTPQATRRKLVDTLDEAAQQLKSGDVFLLTFSGHGRLRDDENGDERDWVDETWVLFDEEVIDDELNGLLRLFKPGVRVSVVSESCNSGTVIERSIAQFEVRSGPGVRGVLRVPIWVAKSIESANAAKYARIKAKYAAINQKPLQARVHLLSACQDNEDAYYLEDQGLFTSLLLKVWPSFHGNHKGLMQAIAQKIPPAYKQHPGHLPIGKVDPVFDDARPFTLI